VVEGVAGLLRELVHAAGWVVLLIGCVSLVFHPHLSVAYLVTPGGGVLAVLQGAIRPRRGQTHVETPTPPEAMASRAGAPEAGAELDEEQLAEASAATAASQGVLR
jgi:hypothetical protein